MGVLSSVVNSIRKRWAILIVHLQLQMTKASAEISVVRSRGTMLQDEFNLNTFDAFGFLIYKLRWS